jgi:hypothetical protein
MAPAALFDKLPAVGVLDDAKLVITAEPLVPSSVALRTTLDQYGSVTMGSGAVLRFTLPDVISPDKFI